MGPLSLDEALPTSGLCHRIRRSVGNVPQDSLLKGRSRKPVSYFRSKRGLQGWYENGGAWDVLRGGFLIRSKVYD